MNEKQSERKPPCSVQSAPLPLEVTCPHCGIEIEVWSDESGVSCKLCGSLIYNCGTS